MCIRCVSKSTAGRLLSSWASGPCALARAGWAAEAQAPKAAGARLYSSLPQPAEAPAHLNELEGKVAHPKLLNADLLKAQYAVRRAPPMREARGLRGRCRRQVVVLRPPPPHPGRLSGWFQLPRITR